MLRLFKTGNQEYTDQQLYQGMLDNDERVFEYLYRKFYPMIRRKIIQLGGQEEDTRDIFQEGLIATWQNARSGKFRLQDNTKLSTYLIQVCKWRWLDKTRKASSRLEQTLETQPERGESPTVLTRWLQAEEQMQFQQIFRQLGERCREILQRFYFLHQSMQQIAEAYNLGEKTAKNEKYRCMQRLKKIYNTAASRDS